jgi:NAD(P)H-dependent nitrite reductase small subunit
VSAQQAIVAAQLCAAPPSDSTSLRAAAADWIAVCALDAIVPNTGVCALVNGAQVAVFRLDDDRLYAIGNLDPLSGANVLSRGIVGDLNGEIVVASPIYKQHFSLASGRCLEEPDVAVEVFPVRLDGGVVEIRAPRE